MLKIYKSTLLSSRGFDKHGFTCGLDFTPGVPGAENNYSLLKQEANIAKSVLSLKQVHGNLVQDSKEVIENDDGSWPEGDALVSDNDKAVVSILTADCVPILLACPGTKMVAAIHAGWKGLGAGVVRNTVKYMQRKGARALDMVAAIGPAICYNCYEVGGEVANKFPESSDAILGTEQFLLDLPNAAMVSLIAAGLTSSNIDNLNMCTSCGENFFSYRASGPQCGRQLSFIS